MSIQRDRITIAQLPHRHLVDLKGTFGGALNPVSIPEGCGLPAWEVPSFERGGFPGHVYLQYTSIYIDECAAVLQWLVFSLPLRPRLGLHLFGPPISRLFGLTKTSLSSSGI